MPDIAFRHTGIVGELPYRTGFTANESLVPVMGAGERLQQGRVRWRRVRFVVMAGDELRFAAATPQSNTNVACENQRCIHARRVNAQDIRECCRADVDADTVLTGRHFLDERTQGGAVVRKCACQCGYALRQRQVLGNGGIGGPSSVCAVIRSVSACSRS